MEHQKIENQRSKESIASLEKKLSDFQNKYFTEGNWELLGRKKASYCQNEPTLTNNLFTVTEKREVLEELERVRHEAQEADKARASCEELRDSIETLKHQHNASLDELNRYQSRNDQLIRQNKVSYHHFNIKTQIYSFESKQRQF